MNNQKSQVPLERIEIAIAMQQLVLLFDAECCNQAIDGLANGVATTTQRLKVFRGGHRKVFAARFE